MPDGILTRIAILQVGDLFIPVVAFQAPKVRTGHEAFLAADFKLCLEGEGFIASVVGCRFPAVDEKHGNRSRSLGQAALGSVACNWTDRHCHGESTTAANFGFVWPLGLLRNGDGQLLVPLLAFPFLVSSVPVVRLAVLIVTPADMDLQLARYAGNQQA